MLRKLLWGIPLTLILAMLLFYFIASSSLHEEQLHDMKQYDASQQVNGDTLTAMTYNLGYLSGMTNNQGVPTNEDFFDQNLNAAKLLIKNLQPDIIGFQEIDFGSNRSFHVQQLDELAIAGNYSEAFQSINWDKRYVPFPYWPPAFHFGKMLSGEAILAKGNLGIDHVITLPKPINAPFYYNAFYLDRLIQVADWDIGSTTIKVINLHLEAFDKETRIIHAERVQRLYESLAKTHPVLLMGDFNSIPAVIAGEDAMDIIMSSDNIASAIPDSVYASNPSQYFTFSSGNPEAMIDYILFNPSHIQMIGARVVKEAGEISDHLPLMMEFTLKPELD